MMDNSDRDQFEPIATFTPIKGSLAERIKNEISIAIANIREHDSRAADHLCKSIKFSADGENVKYDPAPGEPRMSMTQIFPGLN